MAAHSRLIRVCRTAGMWAIVALLCAAPLTACTQAERGSEDIGARPFNGRFYNDPPTRPERAGTLVRSQKALGAPVHSTAWRIMFWSTDLNGNAVLNSGMLVVPNRNPPAGGRTIVSWGHPTTGSAEKCAPSRSVDPYLWMEGLPGLLDKGYALVSTDYTGMGVPGPDSYLIGETEGRNMLDAVRAAQSLLQTGARSKVLLWGHSQGGQAALFAAQLWKVYAPELDVRAVAVAAPATNLASLMRADIGDISGVSIASYAFAAYSSVYNVPLEAILTPAAADALPAINDFCLITQNSALHAVARPLIGKFLAGDPATTQPWRDLLAANTPGDTRLSMPVLVAQGLSDELVHPDLTTDFVDHERQLGTIVTYDTVPGATHGTIVGRALPHVLDFFAAAEKS